MEIDFGSSRLRATVSAGVATAVQPPRDLESLMLAADRALYRAKTLGRNKVELEKAIEQNANGLCNTQVK
jgi:diguanylate cyclase (GGDEF)-like protein